MLAKLAASWATGCNGRCPNAHQTCQGMPSPGDPVRRGKNYTSEREDDMSGPEIQKRIRDVLDGKPQAKGRDRTLWPSKDAAGNNLKHTELCAWRFGGTCDCEKKD
jgi:hypothetical protein